MKNRERFFSILVLCVVLFGMFIIGCNNNGNDMVAQGGDTESVSTQQGDEVSDGSTEKSTENVNGTEGIETTEEIESTESTEEELPDEAEGALKEEEEILKITPTNDSKNNGSGSSEKEVYNAPAVASADNPIIKVVTGTLPAEFSGGSIPAGKTWYYKVTAAKGSYLCIEDESAVIISGGKNYTVNDEGKVLCKMLQSEMEVAIKNTAKKAKPFKVSVVEIEALPGTKDNPDIITEIKTKDEAKALVTTLEAGDKDGYYYEWKATEEAIVDFVVSATTPSAVAYDLIVSVNDGSPVSMSQSGVANDEGTTVTTSVLVAKGDIVTVQVIAKKDADNNYPAVTKASFTPICIPYGAQEYPVVLGLEQIPGSFAVEIPAGKTIYYNSAIISGAEMTIADKTANIIYQGDTYKADNAGIVSVIFAETTGIKEPIKFAIVNTSSSDKTYTLLFKKEYPEGTINNPVEIEASNEVIEHNFAEGDESYYYQWIAEEAGTVTFDISTTVNVGWQYSISKDAEENAIADGPYYSDAEEVVLSRTYAVESGDVFIIKLATYEADVSTMPSGLISFKLTFAVSTNKMVAASPSIGGNTDTTAQITDAKVPDNTESTECIEESIDTDVIELTETEMNSEKSELVESVENEANVEVEADIEVDTTEKISLLESVALRLIRSWCNRLFAR